MKTSELIGPALDRLVHEAIGGEPLKEGCTAPPYSSDWCFGGPIIEREKISVTSQTNGHSWAAKGAHNYSYGPTPLIAAMRAYVASKLGDEPVPEELS